MCGDAGYDVACEVCESDSRSGLLGYALLLGPIFDPSLFCGSSLFVLVIAV